jgi:replicative DNA helicase
MLNGHAPDYERALLALALHNSAALDAVEGLIASDFDDQSLGAVFEKMRALRSEGRSINLATLTGASARDPLGGESIADALRAVSFKGNAPSAADLAAAIAEGSQRRTLAMLGESLKSHALNGAHSPAAILASHMGEFDTLLARSGRRKTAFTYGEAIDDVLEWVQSQDEGDAIPVNLTALARHIPEMQRGNLLILAGRPSMGKSCLARI